MLEIDNLSKHFGGIRAVDGCSFTVPKGSITALIGPNGAGKTTAFNCISRTTEPSAGKVLLEGQRDVVAGYARVNSHQADKSPPVHVAAEGEGDDEETRSWTRDTDESREQKDADDPLMISQTIDFRRF